jgi:hypothetical protein
VLHEKAKRLRRFPSITKFSAQHGCNIERGASVPIANNLAAMRRALEDTGGDLHCQQRGGSRRSRAQGWCCGFDAMKPAPATIQIDEVGPQRFTLTVTFDGQRFECGNYISRAVAMQAGRLFVQRKEGEAVGQRARTRRKPGKG